MLNAKPYIDCNAFMNQQRETYHIIILHMSCMEKNNSFDDSNDINSGFIIVAFFMHLNAAL